MSISSWQQATFQAQMAMANAGGRPPMGMPGQPMPLPPRPMAPPPGMGGPGMGRPPMLAPPPGFRPGEVLLDGSSPPHIWRPSINSNQSCTPSVTAVSIFNAPDVEFELVDLDVMPYGLNSSHCLHIPVHVLVGLNMTASHAVLV